jgi:hypothetical protein
MSHLPTTRGLAGKPATADAVTRTAGEETKTRRKRLLPRPARKQKIDDHMKSAKNRDDIAAARKSIAHGNKRI